MTSFVSKQQQSTHQPGVTITLEELVALQYQGEHIALFRGQKTASDQQGGRLSPYRGRGMDFDEVRVYQAGDDIRHMDWRVTARTGKPHTKLYREERERPVYMVVDLGWTMGFGTRQCFKSVTAAKAAAIAAWHTVKQGDRVGGFIFSGLSQPIKECPAKRSQQGLLPFLNELALGCQRTLTCSREPSSLNQALEQCRRVVRPGNGIFILSDFYCWNKETEQHLGQITKQCDVVVGFVYDPLEMVPPPPGQYGFSDGTHYKLLDTRSKKIGQAYQQQFQQRYAQLTQVLMKYGIGFLPLSTEGDVASQLRQPQGKEQWR